MVVTPETLYVFVSFFGPDRAQRSIAFLSLLNLLTNRTETSHLFTQSQFVDKKQRLLHSTGAPGGGGTAIYGLYGYVPL